MNEHRWLACSALLYVQSGGRSVLYTTHGLSQLPIRIIFVFICISPVIARWRKWIELRIATIVCFHKWNCNLEMPHNAFHSLFLPISLSPSVYSESKSIGLTAFISVRIDFDVTQMQCNHRNSYPFIRFNSFILHIIDSGMTFSSSTLWNQSTIECLLCVFNTHLLTVLPSLLPTCLPVIQLVWVQNYAHEPHRPRHCNNVKKN